MEKSMGFLFINKYMPSNNPNQIITDIPDYILRELPGDFLNKNKIEPATNNKLTGNRFQFILTRCPTVTYFCQRAIIPSVSFGTSLQSNSTGVTLKRPGTSFVYEDLQIGFVVDENMKNWLEIYDWMLDIGVNYKKEYDILTEKQKTCSAYLMVLNSKYEPIIAFKYKNVYPTYLGGVDFNSALTDAESSIVTSTFSYTHFEYEIFAENVTPTCS